jgi:hypothetical protein
MVCLPQLLLAVVLEPTGAAAAAAAVDGVQLVAVDGVQLVAAQGALLVQHVRWSL